MGVWAMLVWGAVCATAHTQAPLYYSNQHQYFLHGLAAGGRGLLADDWLANTQDPTPVFSAAVAVTYRPVGEWPFHVAHFVLLGVYFISLVKLCEAVPGLALTGLPRFTFLTLLVAVHSAAARVLSVRLTGKDYPWFLQCGIANQYLLGPGLQPSVIGVLLVTALAVAVRGRPVAAVLIAAAAATVHATYLLPAALLTVAIMTALTVDGRWRTAGLTGVVALVAVLPVVAYSVTAFAPTDAATFGEAQRLLARVRIPHHARVERWMDNIAWAQLVWIGLGIALVWRTPLFPLLAIPAALGAALSVVQVVTDSDTLALLFPWRISVVLVPVATAVILARLVGVGAGWLNRLSGGTRWVLGGVVAALLVAVTAGGVAVMALRLGYAVSDDELPVLEFIRTHKQPGDVYLIPVTVPKVVPGQRGTASTTFIPPPRATPGTTLIPVDLLRFRLHTGAPLYVDFKSVPYKDADVLEWKRRLDRMQSWYAVKDWDRATRDAVTGEGITHVLATADRDLRGDGLERVYGDEFYRVYRLRKDAMTR
jgi:hypothetical protein